MTEPSLSRLIKEVDKLKKQKIQKVALATTLAERDKLLREIKELEVVKKSPSKLKSFGRTYLKGLKITGGALWRGIKRASANLDRNSPEYREISKGMTKKPMRPTSPLMEIYAPSQQQRVKVRKMKTRKLKKGKKKIMRMKPIKKTPSNMTWDLP